MAGMPLHEDVMILKNLIVQSGQMVGISTLQEVSRLRPWS